MANLKASTVNGVLTLSSISGAGQTVPNSYGAYLHLGNWGVGRTASDAVLVNTAYRADYATDLFDMNISRFTNNSGYITAYGAQGAAGDFYIDDDYGKSIIGLYASDRYQGVYSMGDAYKLAGNGTSPGNLYGIAWTHTNVGGESKAGLGHQALFMMNGTTYTAIGDGIWTNGTITTGAHGTSANWKSAYDWGNHAGLYLGISAKAADSNLLDGLDLHTGRNNEANKVVRTDGNGYIQAGWINSDSGNMGYGNRIARIQCSDDNYIRFQTLAEFKTSIGLSGKNNHSRRIDYTEDANYHVGSFGQNGVSTEDVWHYGSGFFDVWAGGGTYPSGMSHIHGFNAVHYSVGVGGNGYGWQMASQYDKPGEYWARNISGGTFSAWHQFITSANIGSQSVNYAASAGSVAWDGISGKPSVATHRGEGTNYIDYSRYVYNNGAYSGTGWIEPSDLGVRYANTAGSAPANGGRADTVTINYNNDSNSTYQMLWGSGNSVYGSSAIYCNPNSDTIYSTSLRGASNMAGTGEATHHPAGVYSTGTNWLYGTMYVNGNSMYDMNLAYISTIYDRDNNGWYMNPGELSNMNIIFIDRIDNYGWHTNSTWNTAGMFYVGEAGDAGAYPIQCNATRWDLSIYAPNGPIWGNGIRDISDIKKKTNIASITDPISKIKDLRGVTYQWKDINDGKTHAGFIAQEVEVVLPDLVSTTVDPDTLGEIKGVAYSEVIPYLVEAMKAQQNLIEDLQARLAILENNS